MKITLLALSLIFSLTAFANETISTIKNRKTGETLQINCLDEQCGVVEIHHQKSIDSTEVIARLTQAELGESLADLNKRMKVKVKDHFLMMTQEIVKLPWDSEEFVLAYVLLSPVTVPLTVAAVGIDAALLPLGVVSITTDVFDGNVGRKAQRKIQKKKSFKLKNRNFNRLVKSLKTLY